MNASRILAVAALAAAASFGAQADEADASQFVVQFQGSRTRAEVQAEAVKSTGNRSIELASAGTQTLTAPTTTDRARSRRANAACKHQQITNEGVTMNASRILAVAALAAVASFGAYAEADASQFVVQFQGTRTRAEVNAEAVTKVAQHSQEPAGSRVATVQSSADRATVRAQTAQAVRLGQIPSGERSL
jgi:hypothetical protein